jgi:hypothetical protein
MSSTNPPDPNVNTFNNLYWISGDTALTQDVADKRYLRFPTAQGTENLAAINVNGIAAFNNNIVVGSSTATNLTPVVNTYNSDIIVGNSGQGRMRVNCELEVEGFGVLTMSSANIDMTGSATIQQSPLSAPNFNNISTTTINAGVAGGTALTITGDIVQTGATNNIVQDLTLVGDQNLLKATDIYGDLNLRRPTAGLANGGALRLWDITNNTSGFSSQIYDNGTNMSLVNLNNSGTTNITTTDGAGVQSQPLQISSTDMTISTTNPPTCAASSTILLTDDSAKLPSTAWIRDYVASVIPVAPVTLTTTATTTGYNSGGNYTYWYFATYPTWSAFSWIFNTPTSSVSNVNKTGLGSSPPLNVGTIGANGSFIFMTGNGIRQPYFAQSSNMITYCGGFQQDYNISASANAAVLSIINCIGATPAAPFFQSNQLAENNGNCPPTAFGLSGYIVLQALNGNYTGLGTPTITFTQIIA